MQIKKKLMSYDIILILLVFSLIIFGIVVIGSATHINLGYSKSKFYFQIIFFIVGIIVMLVSSLIDYEFLGKFYIAAYIFNIFLLLLVLIIGTGEGATRWLRFGSNIGIQPSEFAKVIMIFFLAKVIDKYSEKLNKISVLLLICLSALIPTYLIFVQPSLSACLVILVILIALLFVGGIAFKYIFGTVAIFAPPLTLFVFDIKNENSTIINFLRNNNILEDYQINRILALFFPENFSQTTYYQTQKSITAIGSGQFSGTGLYEGTLNQLSYLPEQHNDFIFSVIGEEFGFLGCVIVLAILLLIIGRCIWIAVKAYDLFGRLIAVGVATMFAFQTFVNVGVATGIVPNTGMSLPFISYGGSSLWTNMIAIGLVINVGFKKPKSIFDNT